MAFRRGTYDRSWNALKLQAYSNMNKLAGHENYDELLRRFGVGRFNTADEIDFAAERVAHAVVQLREMSGAGG